MKVEFKIRNNSTQEIKTFNYGHKDEYENESYYEPEFVFNKMLKKFILESIATTYDDEDVEKYNIQYNDDGTINTSNLSEDDINYLINKVHLGLGWDEDDKEYLGYDEENTEYTEADIMSMLMGVACMAVELDYTLLTLNIEF